ncbi:MAG: hypothetical protein FWC78_09260, partial [Defluviitaleaceae bacterium]|nr:hypothetical protein [Defluviitaleaceae bacterium]
IERGKFFARRGAENRRALAVRKVFSDEGLWEIYKLYVRVFRWSGYNYAETEKINGLSNFFKTYTALSLLSGRYRHLRCPQ